MVRSEKKRISVKRKILFAAVAFFFLVLAIASLFGRKGVIEIYRARRRYDALRLEVQRLEKEKRRLEQEIDDLKNDPRAVEREAREKLWLMKPEEKVIVRQEDRQR